MKKLLTICLIMIMCCMTALFITGCSDDDETENYTVIFAQEGADNVSITLEVGKTPAKTDYPEIISKKGHDASWEEVDFSTIKDGDKITISPVYVAKQYVITYDADGGSVDAGTTTVTFGQNFELKEATKTGKTFEYWLFIDGENIYKIYTVGNAWEIDKDITVKAVYSSTAYVVSYDTDDTNNVITETTSVRYGEPYELKTPVRKEGYLFNGWVNPSDSNAPVAVTGTSWAIAGDVQLKATWRELTDDDVWTIIFIQNGVSNVEKTVLKGESLTDIPTINPLAGNFGKWVVDSVDGADADFTNITDNMNVYVKYTPKKFTIIYNANGGSGVSSTTVTYGTSYELPASTKAGLTFSHWKCGDDTIDLTGTWSNDYNQEIIYLEAIWKVKVTFEQNGKADVEILYDIGTSLTNANVPECVNSSDDEIGWSWVNLESYTNLQQNTTVTAIPDYDKYWTENK